MAKGKFQAFEKSAADNDKGVKEGSKADKARDKKEKKGWPPKKGKK